MICYSIFFLVYMWYLDENFLSKRVIQKMTLLIHIEEAKAKHHFSGKLTIFLKKRKRKNHLYITKAM